MTDSELGLRLSGKLGPEGRAPEPGAGQGGFTLTAILACTPGMTTEGWEWGCLPNARLAGSRSSCLQTSA